MIRAARALVISAIVALSLTACGNQSLTLKVNVEGQSFSAVFTGSQDAINHAKQEFQSQFSSAGAAASSDVSFTDGDSHTGNKICETDGTDGGYSYHVIVYSTTALPSTTCDDFDSSSGS